MPEGAKFIGQTFYGSIGYTIGATVGACLAAPDRGVVLFVGDGSFQVTCQDLSTLIRYGQKPIIFLMNNDGYTIERVIVDRPYNDIQPWKYHRLVEVFGGGLAFDVHTEGQLEVALAQPPRPTSLSSLRSIPIGSTARNPFVGLERPWPGRTSWADVADHRRQRHLKRPGSTRNSSTRSRGPESRPGPAAEQRDLDPRGGHRFRVGFAPTKDQHPSRFTSHKSP